MGFVAVIGAGPLGGALAHALARRGRVADVRLVDPHASVAQGKALDILQSAPIDRFSTRVGSAQVLHAAAGGDVVVVADSAETNAEFQGEPGLALVRELARFEGTAPLVFAGARQRQLIARAAVELGVPRVRVLGTAPLALESALRALAGLALDLSGRDVHLRVYGAPPDGAVVGWEEASVAGQPLRGELPPHAIGALAARVPTLWPPGPYVLAEAAAQVVEALVNGSRRRFTCFVVLDAGPGRSAVAAMPAALGPRGVERVLEPALSAQERTRMENALERG